MNFRRRGCLSQRDIVGAENLTHRGNATADFRGDLFQRQAVLIEFDHLTPLVRCVKCISLLSRCHCPFMQIGEKRSVPPITDTKSCSFANNHSLQCRRFCKVGRYIGQSRQAKLPLNLRPKNFYVFRVPTIFFHFAGIQYGVPVVKYENSSHSRKIFFEKSSEIREND